MFLNFKPTINILVDVLEFIKREDTHKQTYCMRGTTEEIFQTDPFLKGIDSRSESQMKNSF